MYNFENFITPKNALLVTLWVDYLWEQYLRARQYKLTLQCTKLPPELTGSKKIFPKNLFDKLRSYMLRRERFAFFKDLVSITMSTIIILYNILPMIWYKIISNLDEEMHSLVWYLFLTTAYSMIKLPLTIYEIFVIEEKTTQKKNEISALEKLQNFVLALIITVLFFSVLIEVIQLGDHVLMSVWVCFCGLVFLVGMIYPMLPPSSFREILPLEDTDLRTEIFDLALRLNYPLKQIYVEEKLRKGPSVLYTYGSFQNKSLVIYDFLLQSEDRDECTSKPILLAHICHEIGHWYYNHTFKSVMLIEIYLCLFFAGFFYLFKRPEVYQVFGFRDIQPVLVGVYVVLKYVMTLYNTLLNFCLMYMTRKFITQRDKFVLNRGQGFGLECGLIELENQQNFPVYDHLYSMWHHEKPTVLERIRAIDDFLEMKSN